MKICLAANSGGHLNQLLQLKRIIDKHEYFIVTDKNSFSDELAEKNKIYYVDKFLFKDVLEKKNPTTPIKNLLQSISIFARERPDIIITSGAGSAFGSWVLGKLFSKTIFIESIARTNGPSVFGQILGSRSTKVIVQWETLLTHYKNAIYSGPIFDLSDVVFKEGDIRNIFVTTGTYNLQFDRLLVEVEAIKTRNPDLSIVAQIGKSRYKPSNCYYFDFCGQNKIHEFIEQSDLIICQGGSGSIMDSLLRGKRVIAVPRLREYNEFIDDHQIQLVNKLEEIGLVLGVYSIQDLEKIIQKAWHFKPAFDNINQSRFVDIFESYFKKLNN